VTNGDVSPLIMAVREGHFVTTLPFRVVTMFSMRAVDSTKVTLFLPFGFKGNVSVRVS